MEPEIDSIYTVVMDHKNGVPLQVPFTFRGICFDKTDVSIDFIDCDTYLVRSIPRNPMNHTLDSKPVVPSAEVLKYDPAKMYSIHIIQQVDGTSAGFKREFIVQPMGMVGGKYHLFMDPYTNKLLGFTQNQFKENEIVGKIPSTDPNQRVGSVTGSATGTGSSVTGSGASSVTGSAAGSSVPGSATRSSVPGSTARSNVTGSATRSSVTGSASGSSVTGSATGSVTGSATGTGSSVTGNGAGSARNVPRKLTKKLVRTESQDAFVQRIRTEMVKDPTKPLSYDPAFISSEFKELCSPKEVMLYILTPEKKCLPISLSEVPNLSTLLKPYITNFVLFKLDEEKTTIQVTPPNQIVAGKYFVMRV